MIARRQVVVGLTLGVGLGGSVVGQDRPKIIGSLNPYASAQYEPIRELFSRSMLNLNYVDGKHFLMVERLAEGRNERLPGLAEELVKLKVDLILATPQTRQRRPGMPHRPSQSSSSTNCGPDAGGR